MRYIYTFTVLLLIACNSNTNTEQVSEIEAAARAEAREDSLELVNAYRAQEKIEYAVQADRETKIVEAQNTDDAADDPAIWVNRAEPSESRVYGTNKKGGLVIYNLQGEELDFLKTGKVNNADVTYAFELNNNDVDILGCTNRTTQAIDLYTINGDGSLNALESVSFKMDTSKIDDVYGFCFGKNKAGDHYAYVNGKNGYMQAYKINAVGDSVYLSLARELQFEGQTEGMVVDYDSQTLFVGQEDKGVYALDLTSDDTSPRLIENTTSSINSSIRYDIEGLCIWNQGASRYLIISSQGNFSYAVFNINKDYDYVGSFKVTGGVEIDGVEETDGLEVVSDSLSENYPHGLFVFQDGFNYASDTIAAQNFKYLSPSLLEDLVKK